MMQSFGGTPMTQVPSSAGVNAQVPAGYGASNSLALSNGAGGGPSSFGPNAAAPNSAPGAANGLIYPALHLHPLNDTFASKQISLAPPGPHNRIKIGRQTNAKTVPNPSNGYFDSKVLSRMHAEVWSQDGKVYIKDVKSSNGTFINGERLSPEAQESDVFELHNEDMVEFGIDIVGDDSKTIIHHKVACRVYLAITAEDALGIRNDFAALYRGGVHGPMGGAGIGPGAEGGLRRGKSGMSFDHILGRLQSELQRSRETGNELGNLGNAMSDIHDTLGGGLPPMTNPPYQHMVPPPPPDPKVEAVEAASKEQSATVSALQEQLSQTQSHLSSHVDKIRALETMLAEHEMLRAEVSMIKTQMEEARREMEEFQHERSAYANPTLSMIKAARRGGANGAGGDDFDDAASMASMDTVTPGGDLGEAGLSAADEAAAGDGHVGPRAPPDLPPELVARDAAQAAAVTKSASTLTDASDAAAAVPNSALIARLEALESQLEEALKLGRTLQSQHAQATETVKALEDKVQSLEKEVDNKVKAAQGSVMQALEGRFKEWKEEIEERWGREKSAWDGEREEMRRVASKWDEANEKLEREIQAGGESDEAEISDPHNVGDASTASASARSSRKRRAAKRHLNPVLRQLLYRRSHNDEVEAAAEGSEDAEDSDEDGAKDGDELGSLVGQSRRKGGRGSKKGGMAAAAATASAVAAAAAAGGSALAGGMKGKGRGGESTGAADESSTSSSTGHSSLTAGGAGGSRGETTPSGERSAPGGLAPHASGTSGGGAPSLDTNPHTLPILAGVGAITIGYAAWVLSGKGGGGKV